VTVARQPVIAVLLAVVLGAGAALTIGCGGGDDEGLLSDARAETLTDHLNRIDEFVGAQRCSAVDDRVRALRREVDGLPQGTDSALRTRLEEGVALLEEQAPEECREGEDDEEEAETIPETVPPETVPPETVPPETQPPRTQPERPQPPQTQPPQTQPPPGQGGTPPGQDGAGGEQAPGVITP
jgi:hypothetical protein